MESHIRAQVSRERWLAAQQWEEGHWVQAERARQRFGKGVLWRLLGSFGLVPRHRGDDWNLWWFDQFEGYRFLPSCVENAIELGCGPYTNMRIISERCRPQHLVLSDPLVKTYVRLPLSFVACAARNGLAALDDHPIEDSPFVDSYFELVVLINVLDHVRDADVAIGKAIAITRPGGWLLLGQDLTDGEDWKNECGVREDIGHPVRIDHNWLDQRVNPWFGGGFRKVLPREQGRNPTAHYGTYIFAGRKLSPARQSVAQEGIDRPWSGAPEG